MDLAVHLVNFDYPGGQAVIGETLAGVARAAEEAGVAAQREVLPFGGTDSSSIQRSRAGVPTGTLSIPCRYVHSPAEVIDMRDMEGALKLLLKLVEIA